MSESTEIITTKGHTAEDGTLNLSVKIGIPDADGAVVVQVKRLPAPGDVDANGWPKGFFDRMPGSMPEMQRAPQGEFEQRRSLE